MTEFVSHVQLICLRKRINPSQEPCHSAQSDVTETQADVLQNQLGLRMDSPFLWDFLLSVQTFLFLFLRLLPSFSGGKERERERKQAASQQSQMGVQRQSGRLG